VEARDRLEVLGLVPPLRAGDDAEPLLARRSYVASTDRMPDRVDGDRLLREDVLARATPPRDAPGRKPGGAARIT
jgi:hypothetical protein